MRKFEIAVGIIASIGGVACTLQWLEIKPKDVAMLTLPQWGWLVGALVLFISSLYMSGRAFYISTQSAKKIRLEDARQAAVNLSDAIAKEQEKHGRELDNLRADWRNKCNEIGQERDALKERIAQSHPSPSLQASSVLSKPRPILELIGLDIIDNVSWFAGPPNNAMTLYAVKIRNSQFDVPRIATGARARLEFQHETVDFVDDDGLWIKRKLEKDDRVLVWVDETIDIGSGESMSLVIAGVSRRDTQNALPFFAWSVAGSGNNLKPFRSLGFGKWQCTARISAGLLDPVAISVSFNIDLEGKTVNFGSA